MWLAAALLLIPQFWRPLEKISPPSINDEETVTSIRSIYSVSFPTVAANKDTTGKSDAYILDPHSAIGVAASLRSSPRRPLRSRYPRNSQPTNFSSNSTPGQIRYSSMLWTEPFRELRDTVFAIYYRSRSGIWRSCHGEFNRLTTPIALAELGR